MLFALNVHDRQFSTTIENFDPFAKIASQTVIFALEKGAYHSR